MKKGERAKLIYSLSLIGFFAIFSTTISKNPVLSLYTESLGASDILIGLIAAFSPLAGILFSFPMGHLSDKIGRKKLLIISGIIFLISPLFYLFINSAIWLIPIRFFHGLATAILGPVMSAMIVEIYSKNKGEKLGIYSSSTLIGRTLAPLLGGFIISYFANLSGLLNYKYVYVAAFLFAIPIIILILSLNDGQKKNINGGNFYSDLKYFFSNKKIFSTAFIQMAVYFAFGSLETYLPIYLSSKGISAYEIGIIFSVQILAIALSQPIFGKIADKIDKRVEIVFGVLIMGFAISIIGLFSSVVSLLILGVIFGLGLSFTTIATNTYIPEVARKEKLGASLGGLSSVMDIGHSAGPVITGIVITYFSFSAGFITSLVISLIASLIFIINNKK